MERVKAFQRKVEEVDTPFQGVSLTRYSYDSGTPAFSSCFSITMLLAPIVLAEHFNSLMVRCSRC